MRVEKAKVHDLDVDSKQPTSKDNYALIYVSLINEANHIK